MAEFTILKKCSVSKARCATLMLPHQILKTPVFMPVGTQGSIKGLLPSQLYNLNCGIILGNTYHLGHRPGPTVLDNFNGLHNFMNWNNAILTDSGGFQMVSLSKLSEVTEDGVTFESPHDSSLMLLTPEKSMSIQQSIGADIIMQLDDVVHSSVTGDRLEEAMHRSIRWLDRCITANKNSPKKQSLFAIVQGGLNEKLRKHCATEMAKRDLDGFAIGGLSGGEAKEDFWKMVTLSTDILPQTKPRYLMGVGYAVDLVVCVALGCDMFDCVYPTRTARFGTALTFEGELNLKKSNFAKDFRPIDSSCPCVTCKNHTRAYLYAIRKEASFCNLVSIHNIAFQLQLMEKIRNSIDNDNFPMFVKSFFKNYFPDTCVPHWIVDALSSVGITIK